MGDFHLIAPVTLGPIHSQIGGLDQLLHVSPGCGTCITPPMLIVNRSLTEPECGTASASTVMRIFSPSRRKPPADVDGSTTADSSPPKRAARSAERYRLDSNVHDELRHESCAQKLGTTLLTTF